MATNYPLQWPTGWPRTETHNQEWGRFGSRDDRGYGIKGVTLSEAVSRVLHEADKFVSSSRRNRISLDEIIISTNVPVRLNGLPRSGQKNPHDPGVAVYFKLDDVPQVIPCDKYHKVEQNVAAVAATLAALRTLERHGSGIMERAFTGFEALPNLATEPWYVVLCVAEDSPPEIVRRQYQQLRSQTHPDKSGDPTQFQRVQSAWDAYQARGR